MRDHVKDINTGTLNNLVKFAEEVGVAYDCYEGVLQDNYIFYKTEGVGIGRVKPREYIIVREKYLNPWSSGLELIMTDDIATVERYEKMFQS